MDRLLTTSERVELIDILNTSASASEAARIFNDRYQGRPRPVNRSTVTRLSKKFQETGSVLDTHKPGRKSVLQNVNVVNNILNSFREDCHFSIRKATRDLGHSPNTVVNVLKANKFKPYKFQKHQILHPVDYTQRLNYCNDFIAQSERDRTFSKKILFTDECLFPVNGSPNRQNYR